MLPTFELSRPTTLDEAVGCIADGGVAYVGGTELLAAMNIGLVAPERLVDLKRLGELNGITVDDGLTIGASTRHHQIAASEDVRRHAPMLAEACSNLGNARVRATGSIGGNICFADPRSDVTTTLLALQADINLYSADATRTVPIDEFVLGAMETDCEPDELVRSVRVPSAAGRHHVYLRHQPTEYPTLCVALTLERDRPEGPVRVVIGAVCERPQAFTAASLDAIDADEWLTDLDVIEDLNGSEAYKRHLVRVFVGRATARMREIIDA